MTQEEADTGVSSEFVECPICQQPVKKKGRYGHFRSYHSDQNYDEFKDKFKPIPTPPGKEQKKEKESTEEGPIYKGDLDTTDVLRKILDNFPGMTKQIVDEVCSWAEYGPIHPTQLAYLLTSMKGVSSTMANIIAQKYSLALQKISNEGKLQVPLIFSASQGGQSGPMFGPFPLFQQRQEDGKSPQTQQPQWPQPQSPWSPPQPLTEDRIRAIMREEMGMDRGRGKEKESTEYIEIEDPIRDKDGVAILDEGGRPIVKKIKAPISQAAMFMPKEDTETKVLEKLMKYKELFSGKELTEEKIREIMRQETPPAQVEKPVTLEDVQKASSEAAEKVAEKFSVREKDEKEQKRHQELLDSNAKVVAAVERSASSRVAEGYKDDSLRLLGQGLSETAGILKDRKPVEILLKEGGPLLLGASPSEKVVEEGASEGLISRLKKEYVVDS